jgi:hypothetical protein
MKVYEILKDKAENNVINAKFADDTIKIVALLHDICKANFYKVDYRNAKNETEKNAYTAIKIVLDQYKGIENNAYEEETIKINTLVTKLQSTDYTAHITALGISKFITQLSASNTAFNDLFAHRSYQTSQKETYDVKALRKIMTADYNTLANYIVALANVKTDPFYKEVLTVINNSRKYFSDVLARRTSTIIETPSK